jgi:thioredoxin 1
MARVFFLGSGLLSLWLGFRLGTSGALMSWLGLSLFIIASPSCGATVPTASGEGVTPEAFDALIKKDKRLLVDFHTPWCTPCQKMVPVVDALKSVKVLEVDLDQSEALGTREKVQGVPVFVLYVDGKERGRLFGEQTRDALEALAKK